MAFCTDSLIKHRGFIVGAASAAKSVDSQTFRGMAIYTNSEYYIWLIALYSYPEILNSGGIMEKGHSGLRKGRHSQSGQIYIVTTTTFSRRPVFKDWTLCRHICKEFNDQSNSEAFTLLAWVLMPDHVHWLLQLAGQQDLSSVIRYLKSASAARVNQSGIHQGRLWASGFHDRAIRRETDILPAARYIVMNPVRAGICRRVGHYPFWDAIWL